MTESTFDAKTELKQSEEAHKALVTQIQQLEAKVNEFNQEQQNAKLKMVNEAVELQGQIKLLQKMLGIVPMQPASK